jgi:hypothetical protein
MFELVLSKVYILSHLLNCAVSDGIIHQIRIEYTPHLQRNTTKQQQIRNAMECVVVLLL